MRNTTLVEDQTDTENRADEKLTPSKPAASPDNKRKTDAGLKLPDYAKPCNKGLKTTFPADNLVSFKVGTAIAFKVRDDG